MKQISYSIVAAGAVMVLATFLPFDFSGSMWHPGTLASPFNALAFLIGALAVLQLAGTAARQPELARWCGVPIAVTSLAVAIGVSIHFIPLFDDSPGIVESLFHAGAIGAQALWLASLVAGFGGIALAIRPQRIAAHRIGVP